MSFDSGYDLTYLTSDLNLRTEKFTGFFDFLTGNDLANLELKFTNIIKCNLRFCFNVDHVFFFFLLNRFLFLRMKFFYFCKYFFKVKTCKQNLRFFGYFVS